jgi:hypothetical protein
MKNSILHHHSANFTKKPGKISGSLDFLVAGSLTNLTIHVIVAFWFGNTTSGKSFYKECLLMVIDSLGLKPGLFL